MKIKLDENPGHSHARLLREAKRHVERVPDEGLSGATDKSVWERACAERRFFMTLDLDFSDVRRFRPGTHPGILLLRPRSKRLLPLAEPQEAVGRGLQAADQETAVEERRLKAAARLFCAPSHHLIAGRLRPPELAGGAT